MNGAYKKLQGTLDTREQGQLKKAQRAWLKFRDAESLFLSSKVKAGSLYPTIYSTHLAQIGL